MQIGFLIPTTSKGNNWESFEESLLFKYSLSTFKPEDGYIKRLPEDPWGNEYILVSPGEHGRIDVLSVGLDGEEGTDDDIGNWNLDGKSSDN